MTTRRSTHLRRATAVLAPGATSGTWTADVAPAETQVLADVESVAVLFTNTLDSRPAEVEAVHGIPADAVFYGDWNGDGADSLVLRRGPDA